MIFNKIMLVRVKKIIVFMLLTALFAFGAN